MTPIVQHGIAHHRTSPLSDIQFNGPHVQTTIESGLMPWALSSDVDETHSVDNLPPERSLIRPNVISNVQGEQLDHSILGSDVSIEERSIRPPRSQLERKGKRKFPFSADRYGEDREGLLAGLPSRREHSRLRSKNLNIDPS